jgi:hypothetical protein
LGNGSASSRFFAPLRLCGFAVDILTGLQGQRLETIVHDALSGLPFGGSWSYIE